MFPIIGFCVRQILEIVGSQIETEKIFSLAIIFTNLKRCHLQYKKIGQIDLCQQKLAQ